MAALSGSDCEGTIYKGSVEDFDITCELCIENGNFVEASGYCKNCDEYLCLSCVKVHRVPRPCRHHVVLDKHEMPQNQQRKPKDTLCTVTCDKHPTECLKFFCKKHDVMGCGDCMFRDHRQCKVDSIATLAKGYITGIECQSIYKKVDQLQAELNIKLSDTRRSATKAESAINNARTDIIQYRQDVNAYFDKVEHKLTAKCDEIKTFNQIEVKKKRDQLKSLSTQLRCIHTNMTSNIDNTANMYVREKESRTMLAKLEHEMKAIKKTQIQCVEFVKNSALTSSKKPTSTRLGELHVSSLPVFSSVRHKDVMGVAPQPKSDMGVVDRTDTQGCHVRGMVLVRENMIACTDMFNKSVKLVDFKQCEVLSTVSVIGNPWDVTSISHDTLAVTVTSSSKIQFLEVKNDILTLKNVIDVNGECRGIDCGDDKLVVSYSKPPKVEIIDFRGHVLKAIHTDKTGADLFTYPDYVVLSHDGESIYVSDSGVHSISKLSLDGIVEASYKDSDLKDPYGMYVCRDGSVLVCSTGSIHVISGDCKKQKLLITQNDSVFVPLVTCYDDDNGILCVSQYGHNSSDIIHTFIT